VPVAIGDRIKVTFTDHNGQLVPTGATEPA